MNRKEAESIYRWRKTLVDNWEIIKGAVKSSEGCNLSSQGQLDLFSMGLEDVKENPELVNYIGGINLMEWVQHEMDMIGIPYTWSPLDNMEMYRELYCTHNVVDMLEFNENKSGVVIMDWITDITYHKSKAKGNPYAKIYTSLYGTENYFFLWGKEYSELISRVFKSNVYLFELNYRIPTKDYSKESVNITYLNNIKDVDIQTEYDRLYNSCKVEESDEDWQIKNRKDE